MNEYANVLKKIMLNEELNRYVPNAVREKLGGKVDRNKLNELTAKLLADYSDEILLIDGGEHYQTVVDAILKLGEAKVDVYIDPQICLIEPFAHNVIKKAFEVLDSIDKDTEVTVDYFLLQFIENPRDAQIVAQVIDMDKYSDMYKEKVERFY